ncbi:MAG: NADH-quinone oxidoreductase subunit L [Bdellovibrionales bacterium]|nr:NADH-quinone oxidoreductase subunit L [Bdellovibrionales bacterium]
MNLLSIVLYPLISSLLIRMWGGKNPKLAGWLGCVSIVLSFVVTVKVGLHFFINSSLEPISHNLLTWAILPSHAILFSLKMDVLSFVMSLLITGVGLLIHIYSLGYMKKKEYGRYFSYLNLFIALMLLLVLSDQLLMMFIGWEGVGFCSFLLIGFHFESHKNMNAAKKAFVVNRIGDLGIFLAMMIILAVLVQEKQLWSLAFEDIRTHLDLFLTKSIFGMSLATVLCLLLFIGVCGKSAQLPLYIWLPDAMAGPTPVSALIHAASMVTAGIYLMCRLSFLFDVSHFASEVVMWVGIITALFGSTVAIFQRDIKKVLAFSTVSQLGYMTLACGVGAYAVAMFHVVVHGAFKALLFLCAGAVIKASQGNQDVYQMGGLYKDLPWTHAMFWVGALSLSGFFPFAGFFSKDLILSHVHEHHLFVFVLAMIGVLLTSFYIFRLLYLVFYSGKKRDLPGYITPWVMKAPMIVLAFLAIALGFLWTPSFLGSIDLFPQWMSSLYMIPFSTHSLWFEIGLSLLALLFSAVGLIAARKLFVHGPIADQWIKEKFPKLYQLLLHQYYIEEFYYKTFVHDGPPSNRKLSQDTAFTNSLFHFISVIKGMFDRYVIDGLVHWFAWIPQFLGSIYARIQDGQIQTYIRWITMASLIVLFYWFLWVSGMIA